MPTTITSAGTAPGSTFDTRWRTRDIVVAAVLGVTFGVVFWAWGLAWNVFEPLNAVFPVARDLTLCGLARAGRPSRRSSSASPAPRSSRRWSPLASPPSGQRLGVDTLLSGFVRVRRRNSSSRSPCTPPLGLPVIAVAAVASAAAPGSTAGSSTVGDRRRAPAGQGIAMAISAVVIVAAGSIALVRIAPPRRRPGRFPG
jgi:hypothetical protein